jgi:hypothetical protein
MRLTDVVIPTTPRMEEMDMSLDHTLLHDLKALEDTINAHQDIINANERPSICARWESGRKILLLYPKNKKQLRNGQLDEIAEALDVSRSEVGARIKFARKYPETELSTVIESYKSWSAIRQEALTEKKKAPAKEKSPLQQALNLVKRLEPGTLDADDLEVIKQLREMLAGLAEGIEVTRAA